MVGGARQTRLREHRAVGGEFMAISVGSHSPARRRATEVVDVHS